MAKAIAAQLPLLVIGAQDLFSTLMRLLNPEGTALPASVNKPALAFNF